LKWLETVSSSFCKASRKAEIRSAAVLEAIRSVHAKSRDDLEWLNLQEQLTKRRDNIDAEIAALKARIKAARRANW